MPAARPCDRLLIGISGSIHSLQIFDYLALFRHSFAASIRVVMTAGAARMVRPETVELFVDDRVFLDSWDRSAATTGAPHLGLTQWADLFVVVPATASILGKAAAGIADDLLSTCILSSPRPVVFAPAMNLAMWKSRAVQRNLQTLRADGHYIVDPGPGISIAAGESDQGLAPSPGILLRHLQHVRLKALQHDYWAEATSEKPLTPAQRKLRTIAARAAGAGDEAGS
jgi:phosphopantothenoylcysteine decarboxylase/phosphopantothenate--cysteine ligase